MPGSPRLPEQLPDEMAFHAHIVLVRDEDEGSWWLKGQFDAENADQALQSAWSDTYHQPHRSGSPVHRYVCAVISQEHGWEEFAVEVQAQPSTVTFTPKETSMRDV